jgi:hypothetical protein
MKLKFRNFFKKILLIIVLIFISEMYTLPEPDLKSFTYEQSGTYGYVHNVRDRAEKQLINEVGNLIKRHAPESQLSSELLVLNSIKYNLDIVFVLAQGLLESHFGTKGIAVKTNSVWNVGSYDNGKNHFYYDNPNESIEPYMKLINAKYLMRSDSIIDNNRGLINLVKDHGYKNDIGKRYASARRYEESLRELMVIIDMETPAIRFNQYLLANLSDSEILALFDLLAEETNFELQAMK